MRPALPCLALLAAVTTVAHASETTLTYTGTVTVVRAATTGPAGPADIQLGTPVYFSVTYDPARLVSYPLTTSTDYRTGAPLAVFPKGVPLRGDPLANYSIRIASHTWTLADDVDDTAPNQFGVGPFPFLAYEGRPSQMIGLANDALVGNLEFTSAPADFLLEAQRHEAYGFLTDDGDYLFAVDTTFNTAITSIRQQELAIAAIPEPSTAALMLFGAAGLAGWQVRRRGAARRPGAGAIVDGRSPNTRSGGAA